MSSKSSRRGALRAGGIALTAAFAGCSGAVFDRGNGIERRQLDVLEVGTTAHRTAPKPHEPPMVAFEVGSNRVTLAGSLYVGSGSCSKAVLKQVNYDRDAEEFRVRVGSGPQGFVERLGLGCTGDMSVDSYRAIFEFADHLPAEVVTHEIQGEKRRTTTARPPNRE